LSLALGHSRKTQTLYETGKRSPDWEYLDSLGKLGADLGYILTGERSEASLPKTAADIIRGMERRQLADRLEIAAPDFVQVPLHEADLAAGDGRTNDREEVEGHLAFRRSWLKRLGVSAAGAVIARARGESMSPTIQDGDVVLIDRFSAEPPTKSREAGDARPAPIYALLDDGAARIKRLALATPGMLALLSDNPAVPPEFRPASSVSIIGKVRWWGHTNRE
jgi:phage repressor protein C with HTH and peptisase S24 domain